METLSAYVVGASGLVGRQLVEKLLSDPVYREVRVGVRRPLGVTHDKLREEIIDFSRLDEVSLSGVDTLFCCLGTTIKQAGSQEAFMEVDLEYPWAFAKLAERDGVLLFEVITAMGSNPSSFIFYNRIKGTLETRLKRLSSLCVVVFRPSMLLGERQTSRPSERIFGSVMELLRPIMTGSAKRYRAIKSSTVAEAMLRVSKIQKGGYRVIESDEIEMIAQ